MFCSAFIEIIPRRGLLLIALILIVGVISRYGISLNSFFAIEISKREING